MGDLIYLTGPVRSGKSARAVEIARGWGAGVLFVATYAVDPEDAEMADRVRRHQAERPAAWRTLEAPQDTAGALAEVSPPPAGVILDSLVIWTAARFERPDADIAREWRDLLETLALRLIRPSSSVTRSAGVRSRWMQVCGGFAISSAHWGRQRPPMRQKPGLSSPACRSG